MSNSRSRRPRVVAVLVLVAAAILGLGSAGAQAPPTTDLVPSVVFLVAADSVADALPASAAAGTLGAPLLLTPADALGDAAALVLAKRVPDLVVLVGGTAVLGEQVEADVMGMGLTTRRIAGSDRTRTAEEVARFASDLGYGRPLLSAGAVTRETIPGLDADTVDGLDADELRGGTGPRGPAGAQGAPGPRGPLGPAGPRVLQARSVPLAAVARPGRSAPSALLVPPEPTVLLVPPEPTVLSVPRVLRALSVPRVLQAPWAPRVLLVPPGSRASGSSPSTSATSPTP